MALRNDINAQFKSDLTSYSSAIDGQAYILLGETAMGDTPARIYYYEAASTATVDGENVLVATGMGGVGRFIKNPLQEFNLGLANVAYSGDYNDLANTPGSPGTVTSVGIASSDFSISGSPITNSGNITANLNTSGVSAATYANVTVNNKGIVTAGTNRSSSIASRSLNSSFQLSVETEVKYSVSISVTSTLLGTNSGTVFLETSSDNSTWTTLPGQIGLSVAGVVSTVITTNTVSGYVPAGHYVRLRTATSGTNGATITYITGQEVQQ